jgi:hypothetical protein
VQDLNFHYDREQRLSMPGAPPPPLPKGFMRRNRHLIIILIDIIVLLAVGYFLSRFWFNAPHQARIDGFTVTLRGLPYQETVFATLTVKRTAKTPLEPERFQERLYVRFFLSDRAVRESETLDPQGLALQSRLPVAPGEEILIREAMPAEGESNRLYAEISLGGHTERIVQRFD